ncbi:glycosyltransferase [Mycobacterium sp. 155]|uniref:glycosyltransferase n=1 Tax=Mycobacterium sp. 155 TaxID=1157943 RepID=UPI001E61749A|nr:glycosyltransferase [Mycobacterium sp. 155]
MAGPSAKSEDPGYRPEHNDQPEIVTSATPPRQLTVAHVIHSLGAGGAEAVLVELARAAPAAGLRLVVVGLSDARSGEEVDNRVVPQLRELGATVYEMHTGRYDPTSAVTLARLLRDERVDIVHTHLKHADIVGGAAARLAHLPAVSTLHVIDIPTSRPHQLRVAAGVFARRHLSRRVIALSSAQRRWYSRYAGDAPVTVLPNGVVEPQVTRDRASIRAEIRVPEGALLALCVSLMRPEKGHAALLEAIRQLPDDLPLVVALAGDGPLLADIRSAIDSDSVLRERIRILGFRSDVSDLLSACDFVIQPSLEDALPTSLISALAAARPIVATNVGGIPDIVGPGCGLLVEPGQPAALSAAVAKMATMLRSDEAESTAMRQAGREQYERSFSAEVWVNRLRSVYEQVIGPVGAKSAVTTQTRSRRVVLVEFPPAGGLFQFSLQLGEALAQAGDEVELITGPAPELNSRVPGCRVRSLLPTWHPTAGANVPEWWRRARRGVRAGQHTAAWAILLGYLVRTRPDVVLWSAWRFPVDGWGVRLVRKVLPRTVLGIVAHEPRPLVEQPGQNGMYKTSGATSRALAPAYADLDVAFVLGESARQTLIETWPITAPVHVIPHGDESIFASTPIAGVDTTGPVALCFGTITAYKGIDTLCDAWPTVRARVPAAELAIVGALSADVDAPALRARVAELAGVSLHTEYVPVEEVSAYFARARCVVLPYKRSSQSGVAHLAHTFARPVVATRVGDIPTVVVEGISGLLVAPDDADALADALVRLLTQPDLAQRLGESGARALTAEASWDEVASRLREGLPLRT